MMPDRRKTKRHLIHELNALRGRLEQLGQAAPAAPPPAAPITSSAGGDDLAAPDGSGRRQTEERVRIQAQLLDRVREAVVASDLAGQVVYWSKGAASLYGFSAEEAVGRRWEELLPGEEGNGWARALTDRVMAEGYWQGDQWRRRRDGTSFFAESRLALLLDGDRQPIGLVRVDRDATERRLAEERLRERELFISRVTATTPTIIFVYDLVENRNIFVNDQFERLLGHPRDLSQGPGPVFFDTVFHPDDQAALWRIRERYDGLPDGQVVEGELRLRHAAGEWHWINFHTTVFGRDPDGRPRSILGAGVDVTERKRLEQPLRFTRFAVEHAPDGVAWLDDGGHVVFANHRLAELLDRPREELTGCHMRELGLHPPGGDWAEGWRGFLAEGHGSGEILHQRRDGVAVPFEVTARAIWFEGQRYECVFIRDATDRKQAEAALRESEARYRTLFALANDAIFVLDGAGGVVAANQRAAELLGCQGDEIRRMHLRDLHPPEALPVVRAQYRAVQRRGHGRFEARVRRRDGQVLDVEVSARAVGEGTGLTQGVYRDMTARRQAERAIVEAAEREQRRLGQDLHDGLAQDLKSLEFAATLLARDLVERAFPESEAASALAAGLNEAVRSVQTVARGLLPAGLEAADLPAALKRLLEQIHRQAGVETRLTVDPALRISRDNVATHLYRIVQEAVHNAVVHGRPRRVDVRLEATPEGGVLRVQDDGVGFDSHAQPTGLGLPIMRFRAGMVGAVLDMRHAPGGGTVVICAPVNTD